MAKEKKEKTPPAKFWTSMVKVFFDFVRENFDGEVPSFDGSAPRDLKSIVQALEKRAEIAGVEWTEEVANARLRKFFDVAHSIPWLRENFLLFNLNRQKDKIFFTIKQQHNGKKTFRTTGQKPIPNFSNQGGFGKL